MPISIVLTLTPDAPVVLPADLGRANYAEVLARVSAYDPALASAIHDGDGNKPFTCSGLLDARADDGSLTLTPGHRYRVRVTALTDAATAGLRAVFLQNPPSCWNLLRHDLRVLEACCDEQTEPWGGYVTYDDLAATHLRRNAALPTRATLEFATPTAFKSHDLQVPLPLPALVFGSLVERWNAFSPVKIADGLREFAEAHVAISRYQLESRAAAQKNGAVRIGAVGRVTYTALSDDTYWLSALQILADFALYSGVGVQTATGMGQCRRKP
jgi:CRISPR-associated endoribonuclease Cas6